MNQDIILDSGRLGAMELQSSLSQPDLYLFLLLPVFASDFYNAVPGVGQPALRRRCIIFTIVGVPTAVECF